MSDEEWAFFERFVLSIRAPNGRKSMGLKPRIPFGEPCGQMRKKIVGADLSAAFGGQGHGPDGASFHFTCFWRMSKVDADPDGYTPQALGTAQPFEQDARDFPAVQQHIIGPFQRDLTAVIGQSV